VPSFLDQLIKTLQVEQTSDPLRSRRISGPAGGGPAVSEIAATAALDGREFSQQGWSVEQVVHHYGDLCQAITDLAFDRNELIEIDEFRTLNRCLDNGIADAVTEFSFQRSSLLQSGAVDALNERLGFLAHELRNHIHTATFAVIAIKAGHVWLDRRDGSRTGPRLDWDARSHLSIPRRRSGSSRDGPAAPTDLPRRFHHGHRDICVARGTVARVQVLRRCC
jgi:hypothetical protein